MIPLVFDVEFGWTNSGASKLPDGMLDAVAAMPAPVDVDWADRKVIPALENSQFPFATLAPWTLVPAE